MRPIAVAIFVVACSTSQPSTTELGELMDDGKSDVQAIRVPLNVSPGKTAEFLLTANGPFEVKTTYIQQETATIVSGEARASAIQPTLVVDAPTVPTDHLITVTNEGVSTIRGTLEIGKPAPTCPDAIWIGWFDTLVAKLGAAGSFIDESEKKVIDTLAMSRPCESSSDGAFVHWHGVFDAKLIAVGNFIDESEKQHLSILSGPQPKATGEGAYLPWLDRFVTYLRGAGNFIDESEKTHLDLRLGVRPDARSAGAYLAWVEAFRPILVAAGSFVDESEKNVMRTMISAKPCEAGSAEALAAWNTLGTAAGGDVGDVLTAARPSAGCATP